MSVEDRLILELCRSRPDPAAVLGLLRRARGAGLDWGALVRRARRHRVAALVLDQLLNLHVPPGRVATIGERDRPLLQAIGKKEIVSVLHDNAVFRGELAGMVGRLRAAGIECILLKGLSLNFSHLRWMGDIDLMAPEERLADAIDALLQLDGYRYRRMAKDGPNEAALYGGALPPAERRRVRAQASWNNEYQLVNPGNGVLVEVHHKLFQIRNPDGRFMENIDGLLAGTPLFWEHRRWSAELGCHTLAPRHSLLLSCLRNAIKDAPDNDAFRLSNLADIDNLVAAGIRWPEVIADCLRLGVAPHVLFSLTLSRRLMGTRVPDAVTRELAAASAPRQLRAVRLHLRCVTSLGRSNILYSKLHRALGPWAYGGTLLHKLQWTVFLPLFMPSRAQIAGFFGLRRNSPWVALAYLVNPLRWVYRIVGKLLRRG